MNKKEALELGFVRLDNRRREPLFVQLYDEIRKAILERQLTCGTKIPSSRELVRQLGVSRTTVVSAIDQLVAEGYLVSAVGSGTFVASEIPNDRPFDPVRNPTTFEREHRNLQAEQTRATKQLSKAALAIQDLLSYQPGYLGLLKPFRPGVPALDEFPVQLWNQINRRTWSQIKNRDLSYGEPSGYYPLRESIANYLKAHRGVRCVPEQVIVVAGTQQAIDLVARVTINSGDKILFENPGYKSARIAFETHFANILPLDVDRHGACVEEATAKHRNVKLVYVTPSHQYPSGATLSIERRILLTEWAEKTGALIVEDDYDSEYRYGQKPIPALQGLDQSDSTIYVGSFSKVVFPALSLAYLIVPTRLAKAFETMFSLMSRPAPLINQYILHDFIREGHFARHLRRMRKIHSERRTAFVEAFQENLTDHLELVGNPAGLHCTAILKTKIRDVSLSKRLMENNIVARPLSDYLHPSLKGQVSFGNGLVFGFACATPRQITNAVRKMGRIL